MATAEGRKFKGTHGRGTVELPADWPSAVKGGAVYRANYFRYRKYSGVGHLGTAGRSAACNEKSDRFSESYVGFGDTFGFNAMVCDGDDEKGMRYNLRLAQGISYPFLTDLYPRFVLAK